MAPSTGIHNRYRRYQYFLNNFPYLPGHLRSDVGDALANGDGKRRRGQARQSRELVDGATAQAAT